MGQISIVFHYLYLSVFITCFVLFLCSFLPCDAMHKRGLCCHAVSVCRSVRHVRGSRQNEQTVPFIVLKSTRSRANPTRLSSLKGKEKDVGLTRKKSI